MGLNVRISNIFTLSLNSGKPRLTYVMAINSFNKELKVCTVLTNVIYGKRQRRELYIL